MLASLPEIISIGFDLEEVRRFNTFIENRTDWEGLLCDVFTEDERQRNEQHVHPACCYTLCFCFKEATFKALGQSWMQGETDWKDIEMLFETTQDFDRFKLRLRGGALELYNHMGAQHIKSTVLCDHDLASCNVILSK
jgi:phosphopantetheine--protein transferase-like protein